MFINCFTRFWLKVLVGMFLVIAVNSLVICGINFNINALLIPWQIFYFLGKGVFMPRLDPLV